MISIDYHIKYWLTFLSADHLVGVIQNTQCLSVAYVESDLGKTVGRRILVRFLLTFNDFVFSIRCYPNLVWSQSKYTWSKYKPKLREESSLPGSVH
jgi:hypothetical protein